MGVNRFAPYKWIEQGKLKATDVSQTGNVKARWVIREDDFNTFKNEYEDVGIRNIVGTNEAPSVTVLEEFTEIKNRLLELAILMEDLEKRLEENND